MGSEVKPSKAHAGSARNVTIKDVAAELELSITTISRELTEDHTTLLEAVRDQDAVRAAEIARRHVEETRDLSITVAD